MCSHEYLGHVLDFVSVLAGYQYLGWKLTFQCSSSTWAVCFLCLLKNSNVLCRNAKSSVTFLLLLPFASTILIPIFTLVPPVSVLPPSSWWLQLSGEPRRSWGGRLGRYAQLRRWRWIFWPSDCQTLWWRGENVTHAPSVLSQAS